MMPRRGPAIVVFLLALLVLPVVMRAETRARSLPYWVFFTARDHSYAAARAALDRADDRALARRERFLGRRWNERDLDPAPDAFAAVRASAVKLRTASRWLNAVSVEATPAQARLLALLPGVREVRPVARGAGLLPVETPSRLGTPARVADIDSSVYGVAWAQDSLIHVPDVHDLGYTGTGVRIGYLDAGFVGVYDHFAFRNLDIAGTYNTHDSTSNIETAVHGTRVLSTTAADDRNHFIGTAPGVNVLLVVTEDVSAEYPAEEDYWVTGLEWAEANGADLISSSLSYRDWYSYEDLDGETAVTTIAANAAASRGLLVVNSAGNTGRTDHPWVGAPADGDSVLSVGATTRDGSYASFSSRGLTADGRIKPDVAAMGASNWTVDEGTTDSYVTGSGTSYSTPMVAGVVALMLEANPDLAPMQIISILHSTASQASSPDTSLGWGVVNALQAVDLGMGVVDDRRIRPVPDGWQLAGIYPNPTNAATTLRLQLDRPGWVHVAVFDLLGRNVVQFDRHLPAGAARLSLSLDHLASGTYIVRLTSGAVEREARITLVR